MTMRYIAQRARTKVFLDWDLPLIIDQGPESALSAAGSLTGTISPDLGQLRADDGALLLDKWNTIIHAESDGEIRGSFIVASSEWAGAEWKIEAVSFAGYPHGIPYLEEFYGVQIDPAAAIREIWRHLQSTARGDLGVTVVGSTPVRIGSESDRAAADALTAYTAAKATYTAESATLKTMRADTSAARAVYSQRVQDRTDANAALSAAKKTKDPARIAAAQASADTATNAANAQQSTIDQKAAAADAQAAVVASAKARQTAASAAKVAASKDSKADGGAYKLLWWEAPDCGQEISSLSDDTPLDFTERHFWNAAKTDVTHQIVIGYPRLGRRRTDLSFVEGDNIVSKVEPADDGDDFANEVVGIGAGEGSGALRRSTSIDDGRLRRVTVHSAKDVSIASRMDSQIRKELTTSTNTVTVSSIDVMQHSNASIGSWAVGDDILVDATIAWLGRVQIWHRVMSWFWLTDTTARLKLARSDSFTYGG